MQNVSSNYFLNVVMTVNKIANLIGPPENPGLVPYEFTGFPPQIDRIFHTATVRLYLKVFKG